MPGLSRPRRRCLLPVVAIAAAVLVAPAVSGADATRSTATLRAADAQLAARSRGAVLGLYALDARIASGGAVIARLDRQTATLREQRVVVQHELQVARHSSAVAQQALAAELRTLYTQGNVEPLELVLGAKNITQALEEVDNLDRLSGQSESVLRQVRAARAQVAAAARALARRQSAVGAAAAAARAQQAALLDARQARSSYIASLAAQRRLNEQQIARIVAEAAAAQRRAAQLAAARAHAAAAAAASSPAPPAPAAAPAPAAPPVLAASDVPAAAAGARTLTVTATGYSLQGRTATGLPVGYGVVAVDPSVIPLGTHMTIPGYGEGVAADTGGAVVGSTIDLWFPTVAQADAWGRRIVTIVLH
ncbi:MAG TPA: 3D domain-containing protein [Gaiellaceae bacterium]|nr:3D domain-containing protein [Gaiellaceae bacterium]